MTDSILSVQGLNKSFEALQVCRDLSLLLHSGELHALIGPNGAGKTTVLNLITGLITPDSGSLVFNGRDITMLPLYQRARLGLARAFQITSVFDSFTVKENICLAVQSQKKTDLRFWVNAARDKRLARPTEAMMERMGLAERSRVKAANLSHGERRQLEMAMALATEPSLLLLDEPMAGLGAGGSRKLSELIAAMKGQVTMLLVEHDMEAVFTLADRITVIVQGSVVASGSPAEIKGNAAVQAAYLGGS